ncbi:hypothetical protein [Rhizobium sp. CCGE 510]|uniref:hypothetical protein n=1 Tax=Rhizobium sp. CCGE 510 TaxID=1132836 RepID=UPI003204626E
MFDAHSNLHMGTALVAKVARIVTKWYGRPTKPGGLAADHRRYDLCMAHRRF